MNGEVEISKGSYESYVKEIIKLRKRSKLVIFIMIVSIFGNAMLGYAYINQVKTNKISSERINSLTIGRCSTNVYRVFDILNDFLSIKNCNEDYYDRQFTIIDLKLENAAESICGLNSILKSEEKHYVPQYTINDLYELLNTYKIEISNLYSYLNEHNINNLSKYPYIKGLRDDFYNIYFVLLYQNSTTGKSYLCQMTDREFSDKYKKLLDNLQTQNVKYRFLHPTEFMNKDCYKESMKFYKSVFKK